MFLRLTEGVSGVFYSNYLKEDLKFPRILKPF